jgi:DNA polymerase-3 subunit epsilon
LYNRLQRRSSNHYGLYTYTDSAGYIRFFLEKNSALEEIPIVSFNSPEEARQFLNLLIQKYNLCQKLCGLYNSQGACFHYQIRECKGACLGEEPATSYNLRANEIINNFQYDSDHFWILDKGRNNSEKAIIRIKGGKYIGYGYLSNEYAYTSTSEWDELIKSYPDNRDIQQIIRSFIRNHPGVKIIRE